MDKLKHVSRRKLLIIGILLLIPVVLLLLGSDQSGPKEKAPKGTPTPKWQTYEDQVKEGKLAPAQKILEVTMQYDEGATPQIAATKFTRKNGYAPTALPKDHTHRLQLLNAQQQVISEQPFTVPNIERVEIFYEEGDIRAQESVLSEVTFVQAITWKPEATRIRVNDAQGQQIVTAQISNLEDIDNKPQFNSIQGDELLNPKQSEEQLLNFLNPPSAHAQAADGKLDVVFISSGYTDQNAFQTETTRISAGLLKYEPLKTRASQIVFRSIYNTTNLGCTVDTANILRCDRALAQQQVSNAGVPYELLVVLHNDDSPITRGTGGGGFVSLGRAPRSPNAIAHEFGHAIGKLLDEYVYNKEDGPFDNKIKNLGTQNGDGNCYAGLPPAAEWNKLTPPIPTTSYRKGCLYPNWYASTQESIMRGSQVTLSCFNAVSQVAVNKRMDELAGKFPGGPVPIFACNPVYPTATKPPTISPSVPNPTYACLGSCPTLPPTTTPSGAASPTVSNPSTSPNPTTPPGGGTNPTPSVAPCPTADSASIMHNNKKKKKKSGGFIEAFFKLLLKLIEWLISGGKLPNPGGPTPCPEPTTAAQPTDTPSPTTAQTVNATPTTFGTTPSTAPTQAAVGGTSPSGQALPTGDLPGWKLIFSDDFTKDAPLGSWATTSSSTVVYTGDKGGKWTTYPDGWPCTDQYPGCEAGAYMPSQVLSVQNGVLNFKLATIDGRPRGANPSPLIDGSSKYQAYGRYTFRFKVDKPGLSDWHVAWLMWPESGGNCGGNGEIDFPEGRLSENAGGFHHHAIKGCKQEEAKDVGAKFTEWHTYTIEWKPGNIKYILDDQVVLDSNKSVPTNPMRWQLQTEIKNGSGEPSGNLMLDWVAVYKYQP